MVTSVIDIGSFNIDCNSVVKIFGDGLLWIKKVFELIKSMTLILMTDNDIDDDNDNDDENDNQQLSQMKSNQIIII